MGKKCDEPLVEQLAYFVHALKVIKDRRGRGRSLILETAEGQAFRVDEDHKVHPAKAIEFLERDDYGKPKTFATSTHEQAARILKSMGFSADHPQVSIEERSLPPPTLNVPLKIGGTDGFRGVLKIAYEFVRGHQRASIINEVTDAVTQQAIVAGADPSSIVRWLPFGMFPEFTTPYFCHHLMAWQNGSDVYVIVELFNTYPFAVRLQGLEIGGPILYAQGIQRESPLFTTPEYVPDWSWGDVPIDAQLSMLPDVSARLGTVIATMQKNDFLVMATNASGTALLEAPPGASIESITLAAIAKLKIDAPNVNEQDPSLTEFVTGIVTLIRDLRESA